LGGDFSWLNEPLQTWFAEARLKPYPLAPALDCKKCSRAAKSETADEKARWEKWKCCTFQPFVPNFLLGAVLQTKLIPSAPNAVISPLGLCPTSEYRIKYFAAEDKDRGEEYLCTFFDKQKGQCGIWKNRPSECATFFCEESAFYSNRSSDLFEWEIAVAQMCLAEHGFSDKEIDQLMGWMDWSDEESLKIRWKHLGDRKNKFFVSCWNWAKERTGSEIRSWLSEDVQERFDTWLKFPSPEPYLML
jgi:Fe-S-cluster containining protein